MELRFKMRATAIIGAVVLAIGALPHSARAGERVTLSNGFVEQCDHHALVDGRMRLYLSTGEDSYIEFDPAEIVNFESTPDPPAPASPDPLAKPHAQTPLTPGDLHEMLTRAGADHNLDVDLLASVVKAESDGNARAVSRAGAQGLMQLMPGTAAGLGVKDSFEPNENVRGGSTYLDALLTQIPRQSCLGAGRLQRRPRSRRQVSWHSAVPRNSCVCRARDSRIQSPRSGSRSGGQANRHGRKRSSRTAHSVVLSGRGFFTDHSHLARPLTQRGPGANLHHLSPASA